MPATSTSSRFDGSLPSDTDRDTRSTNGRRNVRVAAPVKPGRRRRPRSRTSPLPRRFGGVTEDCSQDLFASSRTHRGRSRQRRRREGLPPKECVHDRVRGRSGIATAGKELEDGGGRHLPRRLPALLRDQPPDRPRGHRCRRRHLRPGGRRLHPALARLHGRRRLRASYLGASRSGDRVFFFTSGRLVPEDTDSSPDIYERFGSTTTLVTPGTGDRPSTSSLNWGPIFEGISDDGTRSHSRPARPSCRPMTTATVPMSTCAPVDRPT